MRDAFWPLVQELWWLGSARGIPSATRGIKAPVNPGAGIEVRAVVLSV
jgi:hypothetical protein